MYKEELRKYIAHPKDTIFRVMEIIDANAQEIALVVDEAFHLLGVITDGDIRRGLLKGLTVQTRAEEVMTNTFLAVSQDIDRATVLDMMKAHVIRQIPIIDPENRLVGVHFLEKLIGASIKPNIAVIMAGGKGTRLHPFTQHCPKPMIPVAGRPILERIVLHLVGFGIRTIYIAVKYLAEMIEEYFGDGTQYGCAIKYLREEKSLGTAGALSLLPEMPEAPLIVMNGDLVTQVNLQEMLEFHATHAFRATIAVKPYNIEVPYGVIIRANNSLQAIEEKPLLDYLINAGIYVINPEILSLIPAHSEFLMTSLLQRLLDEKQPVGVYLIEDDWADVGKPEELKKANGFV